jgi:hypothetical protein
VQQSVSGLTGSAMPRAAPVASWASWFDPIGPGGSSGNWMSVVQLSAFELVHCADQPLTMYRCETSDHANTGSNMWSWSA